MLRDPVDRVLSNYFYTRTEEPGTKPKYPVFVDACKSLQLHELIREDHPQIRYWISNYTARQLSRQTDETAICPPSQLAREAIENLRFYEHVGLYEDFAASLNILQFMLNWPFVDSLPETNVTKTGCDWMRSMSKRRRRSETSTRGGLRSRGEGTSAARHHAASAHRTA
jgi:hypothetical protein